ncbi:MAG: DUF1934 domain-containing protein [Clostridia bacterium]|nr:DUF1934 domain-containing protein [Clostridia bacterium]
MEEKKKIRLCIVSRMRDDVGELHETKNAHRGLLTRTAQGVILEYDEDQDGEKAHIELTCESRRAQMLRRGMTSAQLVFEPGRRTASAYVTMYGEIPVAIETRRVALLGDELGGRLTLDYAVFVGGEKTSDTLLDVTWKA